MENDNLKFWNKYKGVPANAQKSFNNGKFKGTDINTMWRLKCLTETYGQCGFGWYYTIKDKWTEKVDNGDVFAFVEIELYLKDKETGEWSKPISGNGGNKLVRMVYDKDDGDYRASTSDEAYKMAVTDAIGVACRNLGIGADVYWQNDKTKYTEYSKPEKVADRKLLVEKLQEQNKLDSTLEWAKSKKGWDSIDKFPDDVVIQLLEKCGA